VRYGAGMALFQEPSKQPHSAAGLGSMGAQLRRLAVRGFHRAVAVRYRRAFPCVAASWRRA
jgi:hypothetical protein